MIFLFNESVQQLNGVLLELSKNDYGPQSKSYLVEINLNSSCMRLRRDESDKKNSNIFSISSDIVNEDSKETSKVDVNNTILLSTSKGHLIIRTFLEHVGKVSKKKMESYVQEMENRRKAYPVHKENEKDGYPNLSSKEEESWKAPGGPKGTLRAPQGSQHSPGPFL